MKGHPLALRFQIRLSHFLSLHFGGAAGTSTPNLVLSNFVKSGIVNQYGGSPPPQGAHQIAV